MGFGSAEAGQRLYASVAELEDLPQVGRLAAEVQVLPQGESWNQDLQDELRVRLGRVQQRENTRGGLTLN